MNDEWASSLIKKTAFGSDSSPAWLRAATSAFKLLNVPPLAAIPPASLLNPNFLENQLQTDSSRREMLGDNS